MTNFDKIRKMNDEELAEFLAGCADYDDLIPEYCDERCPHRKECESGATIKCTISDKTIFMDWGTREQ